MGVEGQLAAKAWLRLAEALDKQGCDGARDAYLRVKTLHPQSAKECNKAIARLEKSSNSVRDEGATQGMLQVRAHQSHDGSLSMPTVCRCCDCLCVPVL